MGLIIVPLTLMVRTVNNVFLDLTAIKMNITNSLKNRH